MNASTENGDTDSGAQGLCLVCGLCCNGVIFANVKLQPGDDSERLRSLGLPLARAGRELKFLQPCAALEGCRCRIYGERPRYCREFECVLLKSVNAGRTKRDAALQIIRTARRRAEDVLRLLRQLGDTDEQLHLATRFRRTARRMEKPGLDEETADLYARLTLAVHDLNLLLADAFYPGGKPHNRFAENDRPR